MKRRVFVVLALVLMWTLKSSVSCQAQTTIVKHHEPILALAWSPSGDVLLSASSDGILKMWNTRTRRVDLTARNLSHNGEVAYGGFATGLGFSPDGGTAAIANSDGEIKLLDVKTGHFRSDFAHFAWNRNLYFASNANIVVDADGMIWNWSIARKFKIQGNLAEKDEIATTALCANGRILVSGTPDYEGPLKLQFWNTKTSSHLRTLQLRWTPSDNYVMALSPDAATIAITDESREIRLLNARTGNTIRVFKGQRGAISCLAFSPDGRSLASGGDDSKIKLWSTR